MNFTFENKKRSDKMRITIVQQIRKVFPIILLNLFLLISLLQAEEGMFPMSQIKSIDLKSKGFKISADDIFNENKISLSDAIVNIGGCTGSFVSSDGLILTNHHCAFRAVKEASTLENDYLTNGFVAENRTEELPAKGYTVRITESYRDVSDEVLSSVSGIEDLGERYKAIQKRQKEIVAKAESENQGMRAEVAEMFAGESYYLFLYTYIQDVRMVYVPPRSIGEFGGEIDNWEWPRHNADFAFMRAYVASDGSSAVYSEENVPYYPKKHLQVSAKGVEDGDLVFILGYPARTYRHETSYFMDFEQKIRMPFVVDWYQWQIKLMEDMGKGNPEKALKFASRIKGLSNTEKNYRGKLLGMERLSLVEKKSDEEKRIQDFIDSNKSLKEKYSGVLGDIKKIYSEKEDNFYQDTYLSYLTRSVDLLGTARTLYQSAFERQKDDLDRESAYMDRNFDRTKQRTIMSLKSYDKQLDKSIFIELLTRIANLSSENRIPILDQLFELKKDSTDFLNEIKTAYSESKLIDADFVKDAFNLSPDELKQLNDPFINWIIKLHDETERIKQKSEERSAALDKLSAQWAEVKKSYFKKEFIPDANRTFRLTFGYIKGYSPADAIYKLPFTTLTGVIEKTTDTPPFNTPAKVIELYKKRDFGIFASKKLNDLPVCILYSTDTSGGNSGSPVMNARGELIGLNFDRTFEATINDYAWSASYSRSIGVDIRYVLWVVQKFSQADHLINELGIKTN
jgi:hypothetical protein